MQVECAVVTVFGPSVYGGICDMAGFFYGCFAVMSEKFPVLGAVGIPWEVGAGVAAFFEAVIVGTPAPVRVDVFV